MKGQRSCGDAENCPSSSCGQGLVVVVVVEVDMERWDWSVWRLLAREERQDMVTKR